MKITKVELVEKAQELLSDAIDLLEVATKEDGNAKAYLVDHLKIMLNENHGFLSRDLNLDKLKERYEDDEEINLPTSLEYILDR